MLISLNIICSQKDKKFLFETGISDKVRITSSGTLVDVMKKSPDSKRISYLSQFLEIAIDQGILTTADSEVLRLNHEVLLQKLLDYEKSNRDSYLNSLGLNWIQDPLQTDLRDDSEIIFAISNRVLSHVRRIYANRPTLIYELGDYVNTPYIFDSTWILTTSEFFELANRLHETTLITLKKLF